MQAAKAVGYYATLLVMMRLAGKRLAEQTTTFDLLVLITLGVTVQKVFLSEGTLETVVFVVVVFAVHRTLASVCRVSPSPRCWPRAHRCGPTVVSPCRSRPATRSRCRWPGSRRATRDRNRRSDCT